MRVEDFNYVLPEECIAQTPTEPRDMSRLLLLDKETGAMTHVPAFRNIERYLAAGDVLVFNDTKVIPARLYGRRAESGGKAEVLLLSPMPDGSWECLVKPGKKCPVGQVLVFDDRLRGTVTGKTDFGGRTIRFEADGDFDAILQDIGEMPLPPYIHERLEEKDRYQTVYARETGSAAAPTAGLHFTDELLGRLRAKGVETVFVTLHVGLGTFRPVSVENVEDHVMHREFYSVGAAAAEAVNAAKREGRRIVAVGTTSVRTLESVADEDGMLRETSGATDIFIKPGYRFKVVDALVTNFHLPQSTLLMLVGAMAGRERILAAYETAVAERYRFFSFGDAMFIS